MRKVQGRSAVFCVAWVLFASLLFAPISHGVLGVAGGNSQFFEPKNDKGELLQLRMGESHPQETTLRNLIKKADLPAALKAEMLDDLSSVLVYRSNERIKVRDLQTQIGLVLSEVKKITKTTPEGKTETSTEETYTPQEGRSQLGLSITAIDYQFENRSDVYVASFTTAQPKRVYYFDDFVNAKDADEQMIQVLNEQAHRLASFHGKFQGERFAESYPRLLFAYLKNPSDPEIKTRLFETLRKVGVPLATGIYPNEDWVTATIYGSGYFTSTIPVQIQGSEVSSHEYTPAGYEIEVANSVFSNYPGFDSASNLYSRFFLHEGEIYSVEKDWMKELIQELQSNPQQIFPLNLRIKYNKERLQTAEGRTQWKYHVQSIHLNPDPVTLLLENQVQAVLPKDLWPKQLVFAKRMGQRATLSPKLLSRIQQTVDGLSAYLLNLKNTDLDRYHDVYRMFGWLNSVYFDIDGKTALLAATPNFAEAGVIENLSDPRHQLSKRPIIYLSLKGDEVPTAADFDRLFTLTPEQQKLADEIRRKEKEEEQLREQEKALSERNQRWRETYSQGLVQVDSRGRLSNEQLDLLENLPGFYEKLNCLANTFQTQVKNFSKLSFTLQFASDHYGNYPPYKVEWQYKPTYLGGGKNETTQLNLSLTLPSGILSFPWSTGTFKALLLNEVFDSGQLQIRRVGKGFKLKGKQEFFVNPENGSKTPVNDEYQDLSGKLGPSDRPFYEGLIDALKFCSPTKK